MVSYLLNFLGVFGVGKPRGFCVKMSIKSRMFDAWIVVDGGKIEVVIVFSRKL